MEHFTQIIRLLNKNVHWLLIFPAVAAGMLFYLTRNEERVYLVEGKLWMNFQENKSISLGNQDIKQYQIHTYFQNTIELINSRKIVERVRNRIIKESISTDTTPFSYDWSEDVREGIKHFDFSKVADIRNQDSVTAEIRSFLGFHSVTIEGLTGLVNAYRMRDSHFLKVYLEYKNPDQAHYLIDLFISSLQEELSHLSKSSITKHRGVIEELVRKAKDELDEKVQVLEDLKVKNNIINLNEHTKAIVTYLVQLEGTRADLISKIASRNRAESAIENGISGDKFTKTYNAEQAEIAEAKRELYAAQDLKLAHLKNKIDVVEILRQQETIRKNHAGIKSNLEANSKTAVYDPDKIHTSLALRYIENSINKEELEEALVALEEEIERVTQYSSRFAPFESSIGTMVEEINTARQTYLLLLNKLNLTQSIEMGSGQNRLEIIDYPEVPKKPKASKRILIVGAGGVSVFIVLAALIIILYLINDSVIDVPTFERRFNKDIVAALPAQGKTNDRVLDQSLQLFQNEELKKVYLALDQSKTITVNALDNRDDSMYLAERLKEYLSHQKVEILDFRMGGIPESLKQQVEAAMEENDRVIIVPAPLQYSHDGLELAKSADMDITTFKLGRVKSAADGRILQLQDKNEAETSYVLTNLSAEHMDSYVGEVPKSRNSIRRFLKRVLVREF